MKHKADKEKYQYDHRKSNIVLKLGQNTPAQTLWIAFILACMEI
jgi:hypothetical protein